MKSHHAIANCEAANAIADCGNRSGHLVTEDARRRVRAGMNLLEIGAADAAGVDAHQHLAAANLRNRNRLCSYVVGCAINGGPHRLR